MLCDSYFTGGSFSFNFKAKNLYHAFIRHREQSRFAAD